MSNGAYVTAHVLKAIRQARKAAGITQADMAGRIGLKPVASSYAQIENGSVPLTMDRYCDLCAILKLNPAKLIAEGIVRKAIGTDGELGGG